MIVKCKCLECINNKDGWCSAPAIEIIDIEETENIKMKENNFSVCKTFKFK